MDQSQEPQASNSGDKLDFVPEPEDHSYSAEELQTRLARTEQELIRWKKLANTVKRDQPPDRSLSIEGLDLLLLRADTTETIHYVNSSFAAYVQLDKSDIIGKPLTLLKQLFIPDIYDLIVANQTEPLITEVRDDQRSRVLQIKTTTQNGQQNVVIQDITSDAIFKHYAQKYVPTDFESLEEEDLYTFLYPEKRFMTSMFADLRGFTKLSERLSPEEVRTTLNNYLEEVIEAIEVNKGTVDNIIGDEVMAIFGAPRYYEDHALRAVKTACDIAMRMKELQTLFREMGKFIPDCGIGINTGDMVVGNIGSMSRQNYTVLGASVNLASRFCDAARGGEVLVTESTMYAAIASAPEEWDVVESVWEEEEDFTDIGSKVETIYQLPEELKNKAVLLGPNLVDSADNCQLCFRYLYSVKLKGIDQPMPVISVFAPHQHTALELDEGKVVQHSGERIFGKYRLIDRIRRGGMGEVWKAKDSFGNIVAIKTIIAGEHATERQIARFRREADSMAKLFHRSVCHILEVGEVERTSYIAMEFIDGVSLGDLLHFADEQSSDVSSYNERECDFEKLVEQVQTRKEGTVAADLPGSPLYHEPGRLYRILPGEQILEIMIRACSGVQYAHSHGVLHRDIKPSNIMLRKNGDPVVTDFGLAKIDNDDSEASLSVSGQIIGTIEFMAPEQAISAKDVTESADVYSLGAVLYQMVTGRKHFQSSGNLLADVQALQNHQPMRPRHINKHIDPDLELIIMKALRIDPMQRYRNVTALRNDLERYRNGEIISAKDVTPTEVVLKWVSRNKVVAGVSAASLLTITLVFIGSLILFNFMRVKAEESADLAQRLQLEAEEARSQATQAKKDALDALEKLVDQQRQAKRAVELSQKAQKALSDRNLEEASRHLNAKKLQQAITASEKATQNAPSYPEAWYRLAKVYQQANRQADAIKAFEKGKSLAPAEKRFGEGIAESRKQMQGSGKLVASFERKMAAGEKISRDEARKAAHVMNQLGRPRDAARAFKVALEAGPYDSDLRIQQFHSEAKALHSGYQRKQARFKQKDGKIYGLEVKGAGFKQMPFIADISLKELEIKTTPISDFTFLKGMKLERLVLYKSSFSDPSVFKGTGIKKLYLNNVGVKTLEGLQGLKLKHFTLIGSEISDISPLAGMPLNRVDVAWTKVEDLSPLKGMKLNYLRVDGCRNIKLDALAMFSVKELHMNKTNVTDLETLRYSSVTKLHIAHTKVSDLEPIADRALTHLDISHTSVSSLRWLKNMPLSFLDVRDSQVTDIGPVAGKSFHKLAMDPQTIRRGIPALRDNLRIQQIVVEKEMAAASFWQAYDEGRWGVR